MAQGGHEAPVQGYDTCVTDEGDYYSVDQAAKILKRTPGRIRQMLRAGELEGVPPEEGEGRGWKIPAHVVHDRDRPARIERPSEARPSESPERLQDLESEVIGTCAMNSAYLGGAWSLQRRRRAPCARPWSGRRNGLIKSANEPSSCKPNSRKRGARGGVESSGIRVIKGD